MTKRHLILGGCGFIGRHVAYRLALRGDDVTLVGRNAPQFLIPCEVGEKIQWQNVDMEIVNWDTLVKNFDVVHHYAWDSIPSSSNSDPGGDLQRNVRPTINLLDALVRRGGGTLLFSSSGGTVYGVIRNLPIAENHAISPITAYGAGKATAELYLQLYRQMHSLDCRIVRIANPYGAGQNIARGQGAVTTFLDKAIRNEPITIFGDGKVLRDYIHISDVAECLILLANSSRHEEFIFNIGSGVGTSLNELVCHIEAVLERHVEVRRVSGRSFDVPANVLSIERIKNIYGWTPCVTLLDGIQNTLNNLDSGHQFDKVW